MVPKPTAPGPRSAKTGQEAKIVDETIPLQANFGMLYSMTFQFLLQHTPR
jgi:hypothetical protein